MCFSNYLVGPPGTSMCFVPRYPSGKLAREHMRNQPSQSTSGGKSGGSLPGPSIPTSSSDPPSKVESRLQSQLTPMRCGEQPSATDSSVLRHYTWSEVSGPMSDHDQGVLLSTSPSPMRHRDAGPAPESMMGILSLLPAYSEQISGPAWHMV